MHIHPSTIPRPFPRVGALMKTLMFQLILNRPVVGGYTAIYKGWRWTQWDILFLAVPIFIFSLGMEESYEKILDRRRMKKAGTLPPEAQVATSKKVIPLLTIVVARPLQMLLFEPIVAFISLYVAFVFAVLNAFFAAIPYIFASVYGFNIGQSGLIFIGVGVGVILATATVLICDRLIYRKRLLEADKAGLPGLPPEQRLYPALLGSVGIPIGLFWLGWTSKSDIHWISPALATIPFAWGNTCIFVSIAIPPSSLPLLIDHPS